MRVAPLIARGLGVEAVTYACAGAVKIAIDDQPTPDEPPTIARVLGRDAARVRLLFRAAHELGHVLFFRGNPPNRMRAADEAEERWCDEFAAEFIGGRNPEWDLAIEEWVGLARRNGL